MTRRRNLVEISRTFDDTGSMITIVLTKTRCISREVLIFINPSYRSQVSIHRLPLSHAVTRTGQAGAATYKWKLYGTRERNYG